jgi:hypothetical protein
MPHSTLRVIYSATDEHWNLEVEGQVAGCFSSRNGALEAGWRRGETLVAQGRQARLIVLSKDGAVEGEFAYEPAHSRSDV